VVGLFRAFGKAQVYRGKIFGPILATLAILMFGLFSHVLFYELREIPPSNGAPRVGQKCPSLRCRIKMGRTCLFVISAADRKPSR